MTTGGITYGMDLRYKVSEAEYDQYLRKSRECTLKKPINRLFTVTLVIMPLAVLSFCLVQNLLSGWPLILTAALAIALSIFNCLLRTKYWYHSQTVLAAIKLRNNITNDFWLEHKLLVDEQGVRLACGDYKAEYQWLSFGGFEEIGEMLIPIFNASPMDIIPASAIAAWGGKEAFITAFTDLAKISLRNQADMTPPKNILFELDYRYKKGDYLRDQRDARRRKYTTKLIFTKSLYAKLSITGALIYAAFHASSYVLTGVYIFLILVFNYEHISTFSPLLLRRLNKNIRPIMALRPDQKARLYITTDGISIRGDIHSIDIPNQEILAVRRTPYAAVLYLVSQTMLTVPAPPDTDRASFEKFIETVCRNSGA